ncbi:MAG: hypothetical protein KME28_13420 [Pelatocladus maniniholoensis HA4357-MV3]|jgi:hypothetical protein|uniref:Uncharacterized protein n=1 Tax=Pelatocladus maniniholoensis HA4357-MV3 TaxID=1117104 RepID=A0A9E3H9V5_9NOST|nr:hypothetical protein [Pelatocladus maniniholoensis HA4357-MV3]
MKLRDIRVIMPKPCRKCQEKIGKIELQNDSPHFAALLCISCGLHQDWVSRSK